MPRAPIPQSVSPEAIRQAVNRINSANQRLSLTQQNTVKSTARDLRITVGPGEPSGYSPRPQEGDLHVNTAAMNLCFYAAEAWYAVSGTPIE